MVLDAPPVPPEPATEARAAEVDRRFLALVLDRIIGWGLVAIVGWACWALLIDAGNALLGWFLLFGFAAAVWIAAVLSVGMLGQTPGKALLGLRVVRDDTGTPIGVSASFLRAGIVLAATLPLGFGLVMLAWSAVSDPSGRRRGFHDVIAGSLVRDVRRRPPTATLEPEEAPRHVVNLTAMRLRPAAASAPSAAQGRVLPATPATSATARSPMSPPPAPPPSQPPAPSAPETGSVASTSSERTADADPADSERPRPTSPVPVRVASTTPNDAGRARETVSWRVSFDSGESFVVTGLCLVGRRPEPRGNEEAVHLVPLESLDMSVSKTHAQLHLSQEGALVVMDRGSTNGTFIHRGGVAREISPGRASTLLDEDVVRFGDREMRVSRA